MSWTDWDQEKAIKFCNDWLECQNLAPFQIEMIESLKRAAEQDVESFWTKAEEYYDHHYIHLFDAAIRAGYRPRP